VGAILYVGVVQLGSGSLKDLALALFVGMAVGAYSSIFIATPLLVQLKSNESEVKLAEKRSKARARHEADRYAAVPAFAEDMPIHEEPGTTAGPAHEPDDVPVTRTPAAPRDPEAAGRGRVAPPARGPVRPSGASGRVQPSRQTRSRRGKK
jgi:preprotein translocase subunit SecF